MNQRSRPASDTQDRGLDDAAEMERPWTSTGRSNDETHTSEGLRTVVEYVAVDGGEAQALAQRQGAAIREVLEWLYAGHNAPKSGRV
ncbi:hypothetical protein [Streptomyces malaysiensis]|uniref:Uncharacterized protein n=1 Tax=Streptomyces malaysiensis subsp. samsunensis TaxID=459658 RepID=A0A9X2RXD8_STRMQ|nr:hypothetical protein [Streptomyces samsunensis]MCQ8831734.1 hypothetical protein [Streptomyces samsunensis]